MDKHLLLHVHEDEHPYELHIFKEDRESGLYHTHIVHYSRVSGRAEAKYVVPVAGRTAKREIGLAGCLSSKVSGVRVFGFVGVEPECDGNIQRDVT